MTKNSVVVGLAVALLLYGQAPYSFAQPPVANKETGEAGAPLPDADEKARITLATQIEDEEAEEIVNIGKKWQEAGWMSQKDYINLRLITKDIKGNHIVSDRDLDWTISLLKESKQPLARTRILTAFSLVKRATTAQKERLFVSIAPFLNAQKADRLELDAALRAHTALQALTIIPPPAIETQRP